MPEPTLFERIIAREIPADIIHEDDLSIAFEDINPQAPHHILVIPKKPIPRVGEAHDNDSATLGHLLIIARKIARDIATIRDMTAAVDAGHRYISDQAAVCREDLLTRATEDVGTQDTDIVHDLLEHWQLKIVSEEEHRQASTADIADLRQMIRELQEKVQYFSVQSRR